MINGLRESDSPVLPAKFSNKTMKVVAEKMEGRGLTKGNLPEQNICRTQSRVSMQSALKRIREAAKRDKELKFTSLYHHIYNVDVLREAYYGIKRNACAGVDGETWREYGKNLEENLQELSNRLKSGAYRANIVLRVYIPKVDGNQRPIGVLVLEDKVVQRAAVIVLNMVYETDFLGFSYGFRPGKNPHRALDSLSVGIKRKKINWIVDADIRNYFSSINHEWLIKFVEHRISDRRVVRLIKKWLKAEVLEENRITQNEAGTQQGGSISPLLANMYLHYVYDLWAQKWREKKSQGDVIVVRFADDIIMGFENKSDADLFLEHLKLRFQKFNLALHPDKTRLIEFGRYAEERRGRRGQGRPESFNFLGFTHICGKNREGKFKIIRKTMKKKLRVKLKEIKLELRRRLHSSVKDVGEWLRTVVQGHMNYFAVPGNSSDIGRFRYSISGLWFRTLKRRSDRHRMNWERMGKIRDRWLPSVRIIHPYPEERFERQHPR